MGPDDDGRGKGVWGRLGGCGWGDRGPGPAAGTGQEVCTLFPRRSVDCGRGRSGSWSRVRGPGYGVRGA